MAVTYAAATKTARICHAAAGDPVFEFGYRRAQGPDGGRDTPGARPPAWWTPANRPRP